MDETEKTNDLPPEVATSPTPDPNIVGALTDTERNAIEMLRRQGSQVQMQIGEIEIRKARLLGNMADLEAQGRQILQEAGKRLGIAEGQPWTVTPDGSVRLIPGGRPS